MFSHGENECPWEHHSLLTIGHSQNVIMLMLKPFAVGVHCIYPPEGLDAQIWNLSLYGQWSWNNSFIIGRGTGFNTEMYNWNVHGRWEIEIIVTIFTVIVHPKPFIYTILLLPWVCCDSDEDGFFSLPVSAYILTWTKTKNRFDKIN